MGKTGYKEMNTRKTNPEKLILAVKKYPSIWNSSYPDYRTKSKKQDAWNKVANEVVVGWKNFNRTEKHSTLRFLIRRWNNMRDYYNKSLKAKFRAQVNGEPYDKKYVFADALRFMQPELERNMDIPEHDLHQSEVLKLETLEEETHETEEEEEIEEEYVTFVDTFDHNYDEPSRSRKQETLQYDEATNESTTCTKQEDDPDMMFLKSLLPDMKKLADDEKFAFKYAIMQAYMVILKKRN